ncbi:hypothetical protein GCM10009689_03980 [Brevibacterium antiquum]
MTRAHDLLFGHGANLAALVCADGREGVELALLRLGDDIGFVDDGSGSDRNLAGLNGDICAGVGL